MERRLSAVGLNAANADVEQGTKGVPVGDVITKDGEIVGGWNVQESDALYDFLSGMETKPVATGAFPFDLKQRIKEWRIGKFQGGPSYYGPQNLRWAVEAC